MKPNDEVEVAGAHKFFAADCFNRAWELMDKKERTQAEDDQMLLLGMAALWHWMERGDASATNLAVGTWQVARIHAMLGQSENARHYGQWSLRESQKEGVAPFYLGYAFEALARAEWVAGESGKAEVLVGLGKQAVNLVSDQEEQKMLLDDLESIRGKHG